MNLRNALIVATLAGILSNVSLAAELKPEDAIKIRKANYTTLSWNMNKIKDVLDNEMDYDAKKVATASNVIAAIANSGMGALYIPGSEKSIGDMKTRAKPEIFTDGEGVKAVAVKFIQTANELQTAAASGDKVTVAQAFKEVGASCKACHDKYRAKE